ncbi:condensation domain-containing protein, partial [Gordonia phosphorivorans]
MKGADLAAFEHAEVPFESVVDALNPVRSEAFSPIVQIILSVDPVSASVDDVATAGLSVSPVEPDDVVAQMDLNLALVTSSGTDGWYGLLTFATALFDPATVEVLGRRFVEVLDALVSDPAAPVGDVPLMTDTETTAIVSASAGVVVPVLEESIADAVATRIVEVPSAVALVVGER